MPSSLRAISPLDGRYAAQTEKLSPYFSEWALIRFRVLVEVEWLLALSGEWSIPDVRAFTPGELERLASAAGFASVRVRGEELLASMFGWFNRTVEATADHDDIPRGWFNYAYRGYLLLQRLDTALLEPHLPAVGFYNLLLTARRP